MCRLNKFLLGLYLLPACAGPAAAVFEDLPAGARQSGFGGQAAGLEDPLSFYANPALAGSVRKFDTGAHFLSSKRTTQGPADLDAYGAWALVPRMAKGKMGTLLIGGTYAKESGDLKQRAFTFGWGTWHFLRTEAGVLDFGASLRMLSAESVSGVETVSANALDAGLVFRPDDTHTLGFSILNLNNPAFEVGGVKDSAPRVIRLGVSERRDDYTLSLDLARRSASAGRNGNVSLNPGVEHSWRTERSGQVFTRAGLFLAERASALSAGLGWKHMATEISYGLAMPLTGVVSAAHSLTLALRFGERDAESEYERLIRQEIKYRKDLVEALDESARREEMLKAELSSMKAEIDALSGRLKDTQAQKAAERGEKERLAAVVRRQAAAEAELKAMSDKRAADKLAQLKYNFDAEWKAYLKLKSGGAPQDVLKSSLQRMVTEYQGSGIDISPATMELQSLVR